MLAILTSEKECNYQITEPTWFGERDFLYAEESNAKTTGELIEGKN